MSAKTIINQVVEATDGAKLSMADLVKAYQVDFIGDPGFVDHYFLRRKGNDFVYKVIGHDDMADNPWFVTDVYLTPKEVGGAKWSLEFPGIVQAESEDEKAMREVFDSNRPHPAAHLLALPRGEGGGPPFPRDAPRYRQPKGFTPGRNQHQDANWRATQDRGWS